MKDIWPNTLLELVSKYGYTNNLHAFIYAICNKRVTVQNLMDTFDLTNHASRIVYHDAKRVESLEIRLFPLEIPNENAGSGGEITQTPLISTQEVPTSMPSDQDTALLKQLTTTTNNEQPSNTLKVNNNKKHSCPKQSTVPYQEILESYNFCADQCGWPKALKMTGKRRDKLKVRVEEELFEWKKILNAARNSEMLRGVSWFNIDFLIHSETNYLKVLEGKYKKKITNGPPKDRGSAGLPVIEEDIAL